MVKRERERDKRYSMYRNGCECFFSSFIFSSFIPEHLQAWFTEMSSQINQLSYDDAVMAGRKITHLHQAVDEVHTIQYAHVN